MTGGNDEEMTACLKQRLHATTAKETAIQELDFTVTADAALVQQISIWRSPLSFETEGDKIYLLLLYSCLATSWSLAYGF